VLKQLQQLRAHNIKMAEAPSSTVAPQPSPRLAERAPAAAPVAGTPQVVTNSDTNLEELWRNLLEAVGRASAFTRSYLLEAHPVALATGVFTIGFDPEFADQLDLVNNQRTHSLLQTKLNELGHANVQIKFIQAEAPVYRAARSGVENPPAPTPARTESAPAPSAPVPPSPRKSVGAEEFKNDPLIQKALEIFKGQIVEVRA
jgi:DNA polymerase-3 subunit gamma/tau